MRVTRAGLAFRVHLRGARGLSATPSILQVLIWAAVRGEKRERVLGLCGLATDTYALPRMTMRTTRKRPRPRTRHRAVNRTPASANRARRSAQCSNQLWHGYGAHRLRTGRKSSSVERSSRHWGDTGRGRCGHLSGGSGDENNGNGFRCRSGTWSPCPAASPIFQRRPLLETIGRLSGFRVLSTTKSAKASLQWGTFLHPAFLHEICLRLARNRHLETTRTSPTLTCVARHRRGMCRTRQQQHLTPIPSIT